MPNYVATIRIPAEFSMSIGADDIVQADIEVRKIVDKYINAEELSKDFYVDLDPMMITVLVEEDQK